MCIQWEVNNVYTLIWAQVNAVTYPVSKLNESVLTGVAVLIFTKAHWYVYPEDVSSDDYLEKTDISSVTRRMTITWLTLFRYLYCLQAII